MSLQYVNVTSHRGRRTPRTTSFSQLDACENLGASRKNHETSIIMSFRCVVKSYCRVIGLILDTFEQL